MDFKQIQELIKMINKSNIGELTIEQKDFRVTIKQKEEHVTQMLSAAPVQTAHVPVAAQQQTTGNQQQATGSPAEKTKAAESVASNTITIKSPMIGTFYRKSDP